MKWSVTVLTASRWCNYASNRRIRVSSHKELTLNYQN